MSSGLHLDTRAQLRSKRMVVQPLDHPSRTSSAEPVFFRHHVQQLILSNHRDRAALREIVIDRLRRSSDPREDIGELLDQCVLDNRSEGMEIAIDVLTHFGRQVVEYAREFWRKDAERQKSPPPYPRHHVCDDVWYVLLRAAGASSLDDLQKIPILIGGALGTPVMREASIRAFGDMGGEYAVRLVRGFGLADGSPPMVREAAAEVLEDLEG